MLHGGCAHPSALCATFRATCDREKRALGGGEGEMKREPRCDHPGIDHSAGALLHGGCAHQNGPEIRSQRPRHRHNCLVCLFLGHGYRYPAPSFFLIRGGTPNSAADAGQIQPRGAAGGLPGPLSEEVEDRDIA